MIRSFAALSILLLTAATLMLAAIAVPAAAYEGVLAPAAPEAKTKNPAPAKAKEPQLNNDGYTGLIAPTPAAKGQAPAQPKAAGPGYTGLIAGDAVKPVAPSVKPPKAPESVNETTLAAPQQSKPVAARMTPLPDQKRMDKIEEEKSLKMAAMMKGFEKRMDDKAQSMAPMTPAIVTMLRNSLDEKDGKTKLERYAEKQSLAKMKALDNPNLSPDERKQLARKSSEQLLKIADGLIISDKSTQVVYKKSGAPEDLLKMQKESTNKALDILSQTIRSLKAAAQ